MHLFLNPVDGGSMVSCVSATGIPPVAPTVVDNCGNNLVPSGPIVSARPVCNGVRTYTYLYTDCDGNTQDWVYTYTVLDNTAPVITCLSPVTMNALVMCPVFLAV
jgi:hypothetical protein